VFTHLLVPLDGSDYALRALKHAEDLAKVTGARLTLIGVLPRPEITEATHVGRLDDRSRAQLQSDLDRLAQQVGTRSSLSEVDADVRFGEPAHQITD
jgi:nucleotide-binding universal stress UspA family protein